MTANGEDERHGVVGRPPNATFDDACAPRCVYCNYNLTGLSEAGRCPECGMVNVPQAYRLEVQNIIDDRRARRQLFRCWFRRYPPGWWWSLDRRGDVARSFRVLVRALALAFVSISGLFVLFGSVIVVEEKQSFFYAAGDLTRTPLHTPELHRAHLTIGLYSIENEFKHDVDWNRLHYDLNVAAPSGGVRFAETWQHHLRAGFSWIPVKAACGVWAWYLLTWLVPAQVGVWTQIRRGLPDFARPPRTIIAAANWQACAMLKLVAVLFVLLAIETALRLWVTEWYGDYAAAVILTGVVIILFVAVFAWDGALRSDFTRQLVRSRLHLARIHLMYVLWPLPIVLLLAVLMLFV